MMQHLSLLKGVRIIRVLSFSNQRCLYTIPSVTSTKASDNTPIQLLLSVWTKRTAVGATLTAVSYYCYEHSSYGASFRHSMQAIHRVSQATWFYLTCQYHDYDGAMVDLEKKKCHLRAAQRVLEGLQRLGGIYVKLGKHVSAMKYILPLEWTTTLADHDGQWVDDIFDWFDWDHPLGVASLAQVHKAKLKSTKTEDGLVVAVKLQHPRLDEFYQMDMDTVSVLLDLITWTFPDFGFQWILQEMQEALPQELDFAHEARNAQQVMSNFDHDQRVNGDPPTALVVPCIIWAQRRILCMEFIEGARPDDLQFMEKHKIDPGQVSAEITTIFSKMMFLHGFVHCDPHPGNILIRPRVTGTTHHRKNFDIVLLDHGLYWTLEHNTWTDYAHLWTSLIRGDEKGIRFYADRLGCRAQSHRLFASLLTGREWHTIEAANLSSYRTATEMERVSGRTGLFLHKIAAILATLPRAVLLLLKTSDLLRHLDETLRNNSSSNATYVIMVHYCARAVWLDTKTTLGKKLDSLRRSGSWSSYFTLFLDYCLAWWSYHSLDWSL
ncbi:ABC1 family-domain-containing protein [Halteromyces radiatus]|uniref:ABC1 family-domain-containing protein n=1 Tax=Halteromyces radiatus TaxID=101107 RepID=UPI00221F417D|nr:ABC1 family-domain-containing protein [Halteromyces radiatus]KAI8084792.1 ABC1 family-domain-containing protein [Halteromyces radiatus]